MKSHMNVDALRNGALISALLAVAPVWAEPADYGRDEAGYATTTLDSRVSRLEKRLAGQPLTEMSHDIDRLQEELRKLRGQVEELRNGFERGRRQDREQIAALERRNQDLESRLALVLPPGTLASPPPAIAPATDPDAPVTLTAGGATPTGAMPGGVGVSPEPLPNPANPTSAVPPAVPVQEAIAPPPPPPPDPRVRQGDYERAFETLKAGRYTDAIAEFQTFVAKYPTGDFSDNAHYWLGEAHYVNRDYAAAREAFKRMVADFPQSAKVPDAQLKLAFIEYENAQYAKARSILNDVIKRYPDSSAARMAEKRLERMKLENR